MLINIDETWLNESDFRRRKWRAYGDCNVVPAVPLQPRITLIAALDIMGHVYLSLTQANSNSKTMELYLHHLVDKLERECPNFRDTHCVIWDNAPYHQSTSTLRVLQRLNVPVLFFSPHSYNIAVCELFFAYMKATHLNPDHLPTGKK